MEGEQDRRRQRALFSPSESFIREILQRQAVWWTKRKSWCAFSRHQQWQRARGTQGKGGGTGACKSRRDQERDGQAVMRRGFLSVCGPAVEALMTRRPAGKQRAWATEKREGEGTTAGWLIPKLVKNEGKGEELKAQSPNNKKVCVSWPFAEWLFVRAQSFCRSEKLHCVCKRTK